MDIQNIILIIITIGNFIVSGYIYGRNRKSHINISFALMYFFAAFWSFGLAMFRMADDLGHAYSFAKIFYIAAILIAPSFYYLAMYYPFPSYKIGLKKIVLIYTPSFFIIILLLIPSIILGGVQEQYYGNEAILNNGYYIYVLIFLFYIIVSFILLLNKYSKSEGINRIQLKYVSLGFLFGFAVGMIFNLILPMLGNYQLIWIGPYSAFIAMASVLYLIVQKN